MCTYTTLQSYDKCNFTVCAQQTSIQVSDCDLVCPKLLSSAVSYRILHYFVTFFVLFVLCKVFAHTKGEVHIFYSTLLSILHLGNLPNLMEIC